MPTRAVTLTLPTEPPPRTGGHGLHGRMVYLRRFDAVVRVESRHPEGWLCGVVARRTDTPHALHLVVPPAELAEAETRLTIDSGQDPDGFATLVWHTNVCLHWRGGAVGALAQLLVHRVRPPGSLGVDLDPTTLDRLVHGAHLRTPGLRNLISRLVDAQLLAPILPGLDGSWGTYILTLPPLTSPQ
jgi:hypothetical protein